MKEISKIVFYGLLGLLAGLILVGGYLAYFSYQQANQIDTLLTEKDFLLNQNQELNNDLNQATTTIGELVGRLEELGEDFDGLQDDYQTERGRNEVFQDQIQDLAGTVGVLDKLSKTDKELLQKYSKVSFLNEHYVPESLREIDDEWKYSEDKPNKLHSKVTPFFEEMLADAKDDGVDIWVVSAYRSFETQTTLKGQYLVTYGTGANTFSADQGFSEHQLGTTVDFTTSGLGGGLDGFSNSVAYQWLLDNAHKYGFALSYPKDNAYYVFEPWHWRFVGTDLAKDLDRADASFYDWDQRKIDEYLISVFD